MEQWEFGVEALKRVDKAVNFAETKASLIVVIVAFAISLFVDQYQHLNSLLNSGNDLHFWALAIAAVFGVLGIILLFFSSLMIVFPRLEETDESSYLFFMSVAKMDHVTLIKGVKRLSKEKRLEHVLTQLHAVSKIAKRKYKFLQIAFLGAAFVFIAWVVAVTMIFLGG